MIESFPIHDATLLVVSFVWAEARCTLRLAMSTHDCELVFDGVTEFTAPRRQPWGPSVSVNSAKQVAPGKFEVEIQSGDVLCISAAAWSLVENSSDAEV